MSPRVASTIDVLPNRIRHRPTASASKQDFIIDTNPMKWDTIDDGRVEADDYLHDPRQSIDEKGASHLFTPSGFPKRAVMNVGVLVLISASLMALFGAYPIIAHYTRAATSKKGGFNLGGTNATGQIADLPLPDLIDKDTPTDAYTRTGLGDGKEYKLVFSDEFNVDGRSFYPGDDPFWEAVDLHYWATNNYEWYDPAAVTTKDGKLRITLSQTPEHNLNFRGGMLQSWNKFCFTGGYLEASVQLPGQADVAGLWPAFWTMGNLGRAGYGSSLEGTWPYSYDACDVGTLQNQTTVDGTPVSSQTGGDVPFNRKHGSNALSFLAGQRLSACTCPQDYPALHPGPLLPDGTLRGRSAPEIDVFEAQVSSAKKMTVSQSGQWAPFNDHYNVKNTTADGPAFTMYQESSHFNTYTGELTQQSTSTVTDASQLALQYGGDDSFAVYGMEYQPGHDGYIEWVSDGQPSWRLNKAALVADPISQISARPVPQEPMYIIFNLGVSQNFGTVEWKKLEALWPAVMSVDWVRVYQPSDAINIGCDPPDFPTKDFINRHAEAYSNINLTLWGNTAAEGGYEEYWPRNKLNPNACQAELSKLPGSPTNPKAKAPALKSSEIAKGED
ncbi:SKN1-domain-containing protein [Acaromyces ingoldii]|uniref:SKN1-domain-containing protein n=1 Tax=Acaromyces ingoldii TaxID=215250 RepID=A0A316YVI9_9BASI|nr:SKN1-domain-containing protein [Acaromyces ingoldii]PWN93590.1 SKN1-domain-containing protein [Acaromyces ingoldii]